MEKEDTRRKGLENVGFTVLRLDDEHVLNHIGWVYDYLEEWIGKNAN